MFQLGDIVETPRGEGIVFADVAAPTGDLNCVVLLKERDATFLKLETAYRDLEQVNALKQLGESTAIINHEIKNYMFMISGNAQLLDELENLSPKGREIVKTIVSSVERLTVFSDDILKLNEGTVYAALMRLQHRRWISATWGARPSRKPTTHENGTSCSR